MKPPSNEIEPKPPVPSDEPTAQPPPVVKQTMKKRHRFHDMLAGLPELDHFESDETREVAVTESGKKIGGSGWTALTVGAAGALCSIGAIYLVALLGHFVPWASRIQWAIQFAISLPIMFVTIRWFYRRRFPILLRNRLIQQGVPMCLKCGYNLRGQPTDSKWCPECGTAINEASKALLGKS